MTMAELSTKFDSSGMFSPVEGGEAEDATRSGSGLNRSNDILESDGVVDENSDGRDRASSTDLQSLATVGKHALQSVESAPRTLLEWLRELSIVSDTDTSTELLACKTDEAASDVLNDER